MSAFLRHCICNAKSKNSPTKTDTQERLRRPGIPQEVPKERNMIKACRFQVFLNLFFSNGEQLNRVRYLYLVLRVAQNGIKIKQTRGLWERIKTLERHLSPINSRERSLMRIQYSVVVDYLK